MADNPKVYDIFLSYARVDNEYDRYISHFVETIKRIFRQRTGTVLQIFIDEQEIATAEEWEQRINSALKNSQVMVALLSPSYFTSRWCGREWDSFTALSRDRSVRHGITPYLRLIFPILIRGLDHVDQRSPDVGRRVQQARLLQMKDLTASTPQSAEFNSLVGDIVDDLLPVLERQRTLTALDAETQGVPTDGPSAERPMISTRRAGERQQFVNVLADAVNVTIVGLTNERLASFLEAALEIKRSRLGPRTFWDSLRIVFLGEGLLNFVNDEMVSESPDPSRDRKRHASFGKRSVASFLMRQNQPARWSLYEYNHIPPLQGALFGMADGTNMVQFSVSPPGHPEADALYYEQVDRADHFFANLFNDVVRLSEERNEIVLVGSPADGGFHCTGARFRRGALVKGQHVSDWLPSVAVITWYSQNGTPVPLLQTRTKQNATQYVDHVSHIGGYVNQDDHGALVENRKTILDMPIPLPRDAALNAARRELRDQLDLASALVRPELMTTARFTNSDRENLFFYVFSAELPAAHLFPDGVEVHPWRIDSLAAIHRRQLLDKATAVLSRDDIDGDRRGFAIEILADQLMLHGEHRLAERLAAGRDDTDAHSLLTEIRETSSSFRRARVPLPSPHVVGLAEIHYREFFQTLLPAYAQIGVPGAAEELTRMNAVPEAPRILARLAAAYRDEELVSSLPVEV